MTVVDEFYQKLSQVGFCILLVLLVLLAPTFDLTDNSHHVSEVWWVRTLFLIDSHQARVQPKSLSFMNLLRSCFCISIPWPSQNGQLKSAMTREPSVTNWNRNQWKNCQLKNDQGEQQRREASGGGRENALEEKKIFYAEKVGALLTVVIKVQVFLGENLL